MIILFSFALFSVSTDRKSFSFFFSKVFLSVLTKKVTDQNRLLLFSIIISIPHVQILHPLVSSDRYSQRPDQFHPDLKLREFAH